MRVLYVEDDEDNREITAMLLRRLGHQVVVTALAAEAEAVLALQAPFDVVLVDLQLPDGDGWTVAQAVKCRAPATPVVLLSGWGGTIAPNLARARGVDGVISKPFDGAALERALAALGRVA